jgi:hypothetical protein
MVLSLTLASVALMWAEMSPSRARAGRFSGGPRPRRGVRKVCAGCERQRARFRYHGVVKWDRYHTLCMRCFRSQADQLKSRLAGGAS